MHPNLKFYIVSTCLCLPMHMKLRDGQTKWALRQVLYRHVPRALTDWPKMGFSVPMDQWLPSPLREWAEDLLAPDAIRAEGLLDVVAVRKLWDEHLSGRRRWHHQLCTISDVQGVGNIGQIQ